MALIEINKLSAWYGKAQALSEISLEVNRAETIAIVGANGAGKSTLLDSIMGLVTTRVPSAWRMKIFRPVKPVTG